MKRWMALGLVACLAISPVLFAWASPNPKTGDNYLNYEECLGCFIYLEANGSCIEDNECTCVSWLINSSSTDCKGLLVENLVYRPFDLVAYYTDENGKKNTKKIERYNESCLTRWDCINLDEKVIGTCDPVNGMCKIEVSAKYCKNCTYGKYKGSSQIHNDRCIDCPEGVE